MRRVGFVSGKRCDAVLLCFLFAVCLKTHWCLDIGNNTTRCSKLLHSKIGFGTLLLYSCTGLQLLIHQKPFHRSISPIFQTQKKMAPKRNCAVAARLACDESIWTCQHLRIKDQGILLHLNHLNHSKPNFEANFSAFFPKSIFARVWLLSSQVSNHVKTHLTCSWCTSHKTSKKTSPVWSRSMSASSLPFPGLGRQDTHQWNYVICKKIKLFLQRFNVSLHKIQIIQWKLVVILYDKGGVFPSAPTHVLLYLLFSYHIISYWFRIISTSESHQTNSNSIKSYHNV